jgi:peptidyl-prolyl cis-trans isomerase D
MASRTQSLSKTFVWILLALLIVGLAGFGATNLGGTIRSIGQVGKRDIPVDEYARALQSDIRATASQFGQQLTFQQAELFGIPQQTLSRILGEKALDHEADNLGLSVGDEAVRDRLMNIPGFQGVDGNFDRDTYAYALGNAGLSEETFENQLRDETTRTLLQASVLSGNSMPSAYSDRLISFLLEERSGLLIQLTENDLETPPAAATSDQLTAFYTENIDQFSLPESKSITFILLSPEMVLDRVAIEEGSLQSLYKKNQDQYSTPEQRSVERLVFLNEAEAQTGFEQLKSGAITFEQLVINRGLNLTDIALSDVNLEDFGASGSLIFAAAIKEVVGPVETSLGPALFRITGQKKANKISFEEVRNELRDELALDQARRLIESQATNIDDLLAAGATLEEVIEESDAELENIRFYTGVNSGIAAYSEFKKAARELGESDFPSVIQLSDGGIMALRLEEILPASPEPFDDVRTAVQQAWKNDSLMKALRAEAKEKVANVDSNNSLASLDLGHKTFENLTRDQTIEGAPPAVLAQAFQLEIKGASAVDGDLAVYLVQVLDIQEADTTTEQAISLHAQITSQLTSSLSQDLIESYLSGIQKRAEIALNQQAINAVHANFQ